MMDVGPTPSTVPYSSSSPPPPPSSLPSSSANRLRCMASKRGLDRRTLLNRNVRFLSPSSSIIKPVRVSILMEDPRDGSARKGLSPPPPPSPRPTVSNAFSYEWDLEGPSPTPPTPSTPRYSSPSHISGKPRRARSAARVTPSIDKYSSSSPFHHAGIPRGLRPCSSSGDRQSVNVGPAPAPPAPLEGENVLALGESIMMGISPPCSL